MDCISTCKRGAIKYAKRAPQALDKAGEKSADAPASGSRRAFLTGAIIATATTAVQAQKKKVDGGLAVIEDKVAPQRETPILPPGALNVRHFTKACTACQLCVSACPNQVLRPSNALERLMQPEVSYERGYCRPECTSCSNVCPTGALTALTREEKSSRQIGRAVWIKKNCLPVSEGVSCGNCARHCPTGAIQMIPSVEGDDKSVKIPAINTERCIGCGACENLCPSRPFSAIVVEGLDTQKVM
jgi:formate hydrogenlyase subunit 6/NADH:ubiquinone oxidoreductase subunit I